MSNFHKEIEIKFKVDRHIASKIKSIKMEPHEEVDEYFFNEKMLGREKFLRLRKKKGKIIFELKVITLGSGDEKDCYEADEIRTEVSEEQYEEIKKILKVFFPIILQIRKTRRVADLNGCTLFHDTVDGFGDFLEIEGPREKILEICKKFEIDLEKRDKERGYAMMALKKMGAI